MQPSYKVFSLGLVCIVASHLAHSAAHSEHTDERLERAKRWLNYPINGGLAKVVLGFVVPIRFHHPLARVIVNTYNLQASYRIPANIIYPQPESVFKNRELDPTVSRAQEKPPERGPEIDQSRRQFFALLEQGLSRWGRNGRVCLLRAVCEVAETPLKHNGLIGEIIDVIFTPAPTDPLDPDYLLAQSHGLQGRDCIGLYPACPNGHGLFDNFSLLVPNQPQFSLEQ
ncbi:uncharacterized protein LOC128707824 [Anopheles marshallii]|uniref:uncharacterized protein LOC128707824 n=1 Tax=Anopheles marshallii TaxID=1521116 RepID=UPI00237A5A48|nr:uncharacterized protein LOC128707824 [Anopheles marshallii]